MLLVLISTLKGLVKNVIMMFYKIYLFLFRNSRVSGVVWHSTIGINTKIKKGFIVESTLGDLTQLRGDNTVVHSSIGIYTYLQPRAMVTSSNVGNYCSIAENVRIGATNHDIGRFCMHEITFNAEYGFLPKNTDSAYALRIQRCEVGHDVWVGYGAVVLAGVRVGNGAVIAAGAIVNRDVPPYSIVAGNPARVIGWRFDETTRERLLASQWWNCDITFMRQNIKALTDVHEFLSVFEQRANSVEH